ncbi:MAG: outer membrane lipoprotein carrier protein LolA [Nitrospirae bacterium]|nr:outer membrane lipoprotein carrier protein LolA [Nitrospirota bacterium]
MFFSLAPPAAAAQSLDEVVSRLETVYRETADFSAHFSQETLLPGGSAAEKTSGTVAIKKPSKMRWNFSAPISQEIVLDGTHVWIYQPDQKQVVKRRQAEAFPPGSATNFLAGIGRLREDFDPAFALENRVNQHGNILLRLIPKRKDLTLTRVMLEVDPKSWAVVRVSLHDSARGTTTIRFSRIAMNKGIPDERFRFVPPKGTAVVE